MADVQDLRRIDFLAACSEPELQALAPYCRRATYTQFQSIHEENSPAEKVYAVLVGEVVLHKESDFGREPSRLAVVRPGEMFGFGEVMLPAYYTSASAATDCTLLEIGKDDFRRRFMAVAAFREQVVLALSKINRYHVDKMAGSSGLKDLSFYLLTLSGECGKTLGGKIHIQKQLRQPEIASLLNLSREHVTRLFAKLREQGVVDFNRGFPIIDRAWLDRTVRDKDLAASIQYRESPLP